MSNSNSTSPSAHDPDKQSGDKFSTLLKTPLFAAHQKLAAKIVDFGGWALPVNYGSQIDEHHAVRNNVGIFDVSHMTVSDITGTDTLRYLEKLLANDIHKASKQAGKALYSCMLNENGGVIDDLIVYYLNDKHCRLVTNAGTNAKDMAWLQQQSSEFDICVTEQPELALIAVQGPKALQTAIDSLPELANTITALKRFQGQFDPIQSNTFIGRTGYTGEDGIEIILPAQHATDCWQALLSGGAQACGLGARDTLRLEAGMALYGADLDEQHSPLESGLAWTVALDDERDFIGKTALLPAAKFKMIGLRLEDKGVLRGHQPVIINEQTVGEITSGTFSPTLERSIGIARIASTSPSQLGDEVKIQVRNKQLTATIVKYPFVN